MKKRYWALIIFAVFVFSFLLGGVFHATNEGKMFEKYDLYNCIYNNAEFNGFTKNPILIQKIQDECICFRENNFTNLLEVDC